MSSNTINIFFSIISRFHCSWLIKGYYVPCENTEKFLLSEIKVNQGSNVQKINIVTNGLSPIKCDFDLQCLFEEICDAKGIELTFVLHNNEALTISLDEAIRKLPVEPDNISDKFIEYTQQEKVKNILDIGGRARSGILHSSDYPGKSVTVIDIVPDDGVDIVCDAHEISKKLINNYFDAVRCSAVFEHIIMPWKVAVEMNRVMRHGAVAMVRTHQTIGMHDMPWDYYRYSDTAWHGIFNRHTGFEIIATRLADPMFIIPFQWRERFLYVEKTAGFESSSVLIKKISEATVDWPLTSEDVVQDYYPE